MKREAITTEREMSRRAIPISAIERLWIAVSLFFLSGANVGILGDADIADIESGNPARQAIFLGIYVIGMSYAFRTWRHFFWVATRDRLLLMFVVVLVASLLWTVAPEITLRRVLALLGATGYGFYIAARIELRVLLRLLVMALSLGGIASLIVEIVDADQAFSGLYGHKNVFGRAMALNAMTLLVLRQADVRRTGLVTTLLAGTLLLLILTQSISATAGFGVVSAAIFALYSVRRQRAHARVALIAFGIIFFAVASAMLFQNLEARLNALGRDLTLTGRTQLWDVVVPMIREHFLLGYGYGAFWSGWTGPGASIWAKVGWIPTSAHNVYLDMMLSVGVVGLTLFIASTLRAFRRSVRCFLDLPFEWTVWLPGFLLFSTVLGFSESALLEPTIIFWPLFVATMAYSAKLIGSPKARSTHLILRS